MTTATCPTPSAPFTSIPSKFHINYSCYFGNDHYGYGEQLCGNEGTIEVMNRQDLYFTPELLQGAASAAVKARAAHPPQRPEGFQRSRRRDQPLPQLHRRRCCGKEKVIAPPNVGQQAAISGHMATLSFKNQKKVVWDEKTNKYHFV